MKKQPAKFEKSRKDVEKSNLKEGSKKEEAYDVKQKKVPGYKCGGMVGKKK